MRLPFWRPVTPATARRNRCSRSSPTRARGRAGVAHRGASGAFAPGRGYLIAAPITFRGITWMRAGIAGQAVEGDREALRDLYAAAAQHWVDDGHRQHAVFVPSHDAELVDAWFRLCFGALGGDGDPRDRAGRGAVRRQRGDPAGDSRRLRGGRASRAGDGRRDGAVAELLGRSSAQTYEEVLAEWREEEDWDQYELFVAERDGRVVGHILLYRRPPDLRVPENSIDLAQAVDRAGGARHRRRPRADRSTCSPGRTSRAFP